VGKHCAEAVNQIANSGHGEKCAEQPRHVPGSIREVADDEQVKAEQDQACGPNVVEAVDFRECLGVHLGWSEHGEVAVVVEQV
jgi:hypothetical protein